MDFGVLVNRFAHHNEQARLRQSRDVLVQVWISAADARRLGQISRKGAMVDSAVH
jgi:hypothetical protein